MRPATPQTMLEIAHYLRAVIANKRRVLDVELGEGALGMILGMIQGGDCGGVEIEAMMEDVAVELARVPGGEHSALAVRYALAVHQENEHDMQRDDVPMNPYLAEAAIVLLARPIEDLDDRLADIDRRLHQMLATKGGRR